VKYYEILIKAAAKIIKKNIEIFVLILGEGSERNMLEKLIAKLNLNNCVKMPGERKDAIYFLKGSDVFILTSKYEGLSIAMIEAMSHGLPVIASDAPGITRYINHGLNGLLFEVGEYRALAQHTVTLAKDKQLREKLSHGARKTFENEFDIKKNIQSIDAAFKENIRTHSTIEK
jgi:glycosyltransferase involved in cell wall biosynthesis